MPEGYRSSYLTDQKTQYDTSGSRLTPWKRASLTEKPALRAACLNLKTKKPLPLPRLPRLSRSIQATLERLEGNTLLKSPKTLKEWKDKYNELLSFSKLLLKNASSMPINPDKLLKEKRKGMLLRTPQISCDVDSSNYPLGSPKESPLCASPSSPSSEIVWDSLPPTPTSGASDYNRAIIDVTSLVLDGPLASTKISEGHVSKDNVREVKNQHYGR